MKMRIILFILVSVFSGTCFSQSLPALPNTDSVITCFPDTTGYVRITVGPVGRDYTDLQMAINAAQQGTLIILDAGQIFHGGFVLPDKIGNGWIILTGSRMDLLPSEATRIQPFAATSDPVFPTQASAMPKIVTNNLSGIPCFRTDPNAHHYWFAGIEITADTNVINSYGLINFGDASSGQNSLAIVPHHLNIDRCYIHGHSNAQIMKYGVRLDCENAAITDSYISEFHSIGFDAQAICGINGPGKFKIINNYIEASGENVMFGGAAPAIPGLVPSDIEIRQNYFYKPFSWRVGDPSYAGHHWTIKNLFELKTGMRVLLDGNVMENSWADLPTGQSGYAILLTIRTEGGAAPQADVSDITISNNIIKHCGAGISLSGTDGGLGNRSSRINIYNNLFDDINGPAYGDMNTSGSNDGTFIKIGEPQDVFINHNTIFQSGPVTWAYDTTYRFVFTNNIVNNNVSTGGYQGIYGPGNIQGNNTIAHYFPDVNDSNLHLNKNVFISGDSSKYSNFSNQSTNYFPAINTIVGFINYSNGSTDYHDYALNNSSIYLNNGSDNKNIGINISSLDSAINAIRICQSVTLIQNQELENEIRIYPNPETDILNIEMREIADSFFIMDLMGKIIFQNEVLDKNIQVNVKDFKAGIYFVKIIKNKEVFSKAFMVLR